MRLRYFPALGAAVGLISGLVVTTGPLNTPFFLAYGLRRGAYVGTEAVCAMVMHLSRGAALRALRALDLGDRRGGRPARRDDVRGLLVRAPAARSA